MAPRSRPFPIVLALFFLSGFAGLLYEVAWTRQLGLVFGTAELAVATVLAAYLGGLGIGAAVAGPRVRQVRRPLLAYGLLEMGVGLSALLVPLALRSARALLVLTFGGQETLPDAGGWGTAAFDLATSFAILVVPTALMGATLPLLARYGVRRDDEVGSRIGALYAANTAGAVAGSVAAGFLLLPALGLTRTVLVAVAANGLVFLGVLALARAGSPDVPAAATAPAEASETPSWVLPALALSGMASLTYEVFWTRLLTHLQGGGTEAFATMLASFLSGIALGSAVAAPLARTARGSRLGFAGAQMGIALLSLVSYVVLNALPDLGPLAQRRIWVGPAMAALALLPGAVFMGATFPFAVRLLARDASEAGPASARAYAWNTLGAIAGSTGAAFLLLPRFGFEGTLAWAVGLNLLLAIAASILGRPRETVPAVAALVALALLILIPPATPWRILEATPLRPTLPGRVVFHAVGRNATVLVAESDGEWSVRTNGLPEETIQPPGLPPSRHMTTRWLGALPALVRPKARTLLVVGLGGGVAVESVPPTFRSVDVVEIEPEVVSANRAVAGQRAKDPLSDPRVRVRIGDARTALLLSRARFEAIVSQPSHPWTAASSLYTREFFGLCRDHLTPDGVFVQWIGLPFLDETLFRSLVATLGAVFPHVNAYRPPTSAEVLFVASEAPLGLPSAEDILAAGPDLPAIGIATPEDLAAALILDSEGARKLAAGAPLNTDGHNRLEAGSYRALRRGLEHTRFEVVLAPFDPQTRIGGVDRLRLVRRLTEMGLLVRAQRLVASLSDPAERAAGQGLVAMATGDVALAQALLDDAMASAPSLAEARGARLLLARAAVGRGEPPPSRLRPPTDPEDAVAEGWRASDRDDADGVSALEGRLARLEPAHPLFAEASRLRALWRVATREPARAKEANSILDVVLSREPLLDDVLLRASSSLILGDSRAALACLSDVSWRVAAHPQHEKLSARVLQLLDRIPASEDLDTWKEDVRRRFGGS